MGKITLLYARSHTLGGAAIRLFQWFAPWNHAAILTPEGTVLNAIWSWNADKSGCKEEEFDTWATRYSEYVRVEVDVPDPAAGIAWAREMVARKRKYNHKSLIKMISSKLGGTPDLDRDECISYVETALAMAGRCRWRAPLASISVSQSFKVL